MRIGTKSVLFGVHQFFVHPWFIAAAWWKLYGFPWDPRLWVAFVVHDLGYFGKPNMDGPEGERHVELGAKILHKLFDWGRIFEYKEINTRATGVPGRVDGRELVDGLNDLGREGWALCNVGEHLIHFIRPTRRRRWHDFTMYHSRSWCKKHGRQISKLGIADKLAIVLTPAWLYLPMANASGEIHEYMRLTVAGKYATMQISQRGQREWYRDVCEYLRKWVDEHKDGRADTWTPEAPP